MTEKKQKQETFEKYKKRLEEISDMKFGTLSDDDILHALAERKEILLFEEHEQERLIQEEKEAEEKLLKEQEANEKKIRQERRVVITEKIEALNQSISPDKKDDDLLTLIQERRKLEDELSSLDSAPVSSQTDSEKVQDAVDASLGEKILPLKKETVISTISPQEESTSLQKTETSKEKQEENPLNAFPEALAREKKDDFGTETIRNTGIEKSGEFMRYFDQLERNLGSLGELLQRLPLAAKQNKAFMLKVAKVDPAYAMHYADQNTLKMDEDFNIQVAALDNKRNSGNALAEMLPSMRTSKVLLVAVKRDYRNVKFIESTMADYDELIAIAKRGALKKISDLKEAADVDLLVPKILQQDKEFMTQARALVEKK